MRPGEPRDLVEPPMTLRDWTDPRDGRHWKLRQTGLPVVLIFANEAEVIRVRVDFSGLEDRSDEDLQRLLDEGWG